MPETTREERRAHLHKIKLLAESLRGTLCPGCSGKKKARRSLCGSCYGSLPAEMKRGLYDGFGKGYEEAIENTLEYIVADYAGIEDLRPTSEP